MKVPEEEKSLILHCCVQRGSAPATCSTQACVRRAAGGRRSGRSFSHDRERA